MRIVAVCALLAVTSVHAETPKSTDARAALKPLNILVGTWKGTGTPEGTPDERQKGHWIETVACAWQFKGDDVWVKIDFDKGKHFRTAELRATGKKDEVELTVTNTAKEKLVYTGTLTARQLAVERTLADTKQVERLTFALLHDNRITYRLETRPANGATYTRKYLVGLTKEGVPFVNVGPDIRECIVSGGKGTLAVTHGGQTYYVCCSGCRDEFKANPDKYIAERAAKRK